MKGKIYLFSFILVMIIAFVMFVGFMAETPKSKIKLKESSISEIKKDVFRIKHFEGIVIVSSDIQTNSRYVVYYHMVDPVIKDYFDTYFSRKAIMDKEPLFIKGSDGKEINDRIIHLINHQFICTPYSSMIGSRFVPEISNKIVSVCGLSIPPVYGELTGMINIYLSKEPTDEEKALLKVVLSDISDDITLEMKKP